jgi:hypothetical protein
VSEIAPLHPREDTFPGEVFLRPRRGRAGLCGASRADPLPLEGLRERFVPERAFRGRQNAKLQYAVLAAAAVQGGTEPGLLDEVAWWQADDFWQYALFAAVACIRADASQAASRCARRARTSPRALPPSAITTSSGHSPAGHLTEGPPIMTSSRSR